MNNGTNIVYDIENKLFSYFHKTKKPDTTF
jgi:hypothetical protein